MKNDRRRGRYANVKRQNKLRTVFLFDNVDDDTVEDVITEILDLDIDKKKRPIRLFICTGGGTTAAGFALIDVMQRTRCPIITFAMGEVCSMGVPIFVAGAKRIIATHAYLMCHPISECVNDYGSFIKSRVKNMEELEVMYDDFILKHTKIPIEIYNQSRNSELWIGAENAVKYGMADEIL